MGMLSFYYNQLANRPKPIPQDIVGLSDRTVLLTGASAGLGYEAARELVSRGVGHLILAVRDEKKKGEKLRADLLASKSQSRVDIWELDYNDYESINRFADRVNGLDRLDFVLLNAGVMQTDFVKSTTGHELMLQVNHLSTALLSLHLLPKLKATAAEIAQPTSHYNHF